MAKIASGNLALEIEIESAERYQSIIYNIKMTCNGIDILNPQIFCARNIQANELSVGDFGRDYLSWTVDEVIRTQRCMHWWGMEPDVTVAFCPESEVPFFLCSGTSQPDRYVVIVFADSRNFSNETGYWSQGPGLVLRCHVNQLREFSADIKRDYEAMIG